MQGIVCKVIGHNRGREEKVGKLEMMSSEESDCDTHSGSDNEDCVTSMFINPPLQWRNDKVTALFKSLDGKTRKNQSRRSQEMIQQRIVNWCS